VLHRDLMSQHNECPAVGVRMELPLIVRIA
jgi:hypothetical protein